MSTRPRTLTTAAALEAAEGVAALLFGLFAGWETFFGEPSNAAGAAAVALVGIFSGAGMLAVAAGLLKTRRWSRAPAVVTQLFAFFISWNLIQSDQLAFGVPLVACALATAILLFSRPSIEAWYENSH